MSRIHPRTAALEYVVDRAAAGRLVAVAAPAVLEVAYGYGLRARTDSRFAALLDWFSRLVVGPALRVVPLDARAAIVAGRLRGESPHPTGRRRRDERSKTMRQASWLLDIEIAATAFAAGFDVATDNRRDFEELSRLLTKLYPDAPALSVEDPPVQL